MKTLYTPLLIILLSTFHASSQSHFITAGQTDQMIFTDYVPDTSIKPLPLNPPPYQDTGSLVIDINHDGMDDLKVSFRWWGSSGGSETSYRIYCLGQNTVMSNLEKKILYGVCGLACDTAYYTVAKRYNFGDTITSISDSGWQSEGVLYINGGSSSLGGYTLTNGGSLPRDTPFYYAFRIINQTDTTLGYLHFYYPSNRFKFMDFACEGPTSSYIISSVNNISSSSISISPNPFTSYIHITADKPFQYNISDYLGRVVLTGTTDKTIATEALASGNYVLTIKNEEMVTVRKMVKY
jgi:hypothetical protein